MNGKTRVTAVVLQVTADQQLEVSSPKDPSTKLSGLAAVVVCQSLG